MNNKKSIGIENTQDNRTTKSTMICLLILILAQKVSSQLKKQLTLAQFKIAKHQEIIKKHEAAVKRKKEAEGAKKFKKEKKQKVSSTTSKNKNNKNMKKSTTPKSKGRKKEKW